MSSVPLILVEAHNAFSLDRYLILKEKSTNFNENGQIDDYNR